MIDGRKERIIRAIKIIELTETQPAQKSIEWLNKRTECITGSECAAALNVNPYKTQDGYIKEKVISKLGGRYFKGNVATRFGEKYEPVSTLINEFRINEQKKEPNLKTIEVDSYVVKIYPSCFIKHEKYDFIGASPDGIVFVFKPSVNISYENSFSVGELVDMYKKGLIIDVYLAEYKCPLKRVIGDSVPNHYYVQIQQQLAVVNFKECIYTDCNFIEYTREEFLNDNSSLYTGICLEFYEPLESKYTYAYPKNNISLWKNKEKRKNFIDIIDDEINNIINDYKNKNYTFINTCYWKLDNFSNISVLYEENWLEGNIEKFKQIYEKINEETTKAKMEPDKFYNPSGKKRKIKLQFTSKDIDSDED